jgi:hypothetical protein
MKLEYAKAPKWVDAEHTMIDLMVKWDRFNEELPFAASPNDCEEHGRAIFAAAVAGDYGPIAEYVPPPEIVSGPTPSSGDIPVTES